MSTYFAIIYCEDVGYFKVDFYHIDKFEFSWRSADSSKWPKHQVEFEDPKTSVMNKGLIKFIGFENEVDLKLTEFIKSSKDTLNASESDVIRKLKLQIVAQSIKINRLEKLLNDVTYEVHYIKTNLCPERKDAKVFGRKPMVVSSNDISVTIEESTDLKGFSMLAESILNFYIDEQAALGNTWKKLAQPTKTKLEDLMIKFVEAKIAFEKDNPPVQVVAKRKRSKALADEHPETVEITKRKRKEKVNEVTLSQGPRKDLLLSRFSKKLSNRKQKLAKLMNNEELELESIAANLNNMNENDDVSDNDSLYDGPM